MTRTARIAAYRQRLQERISRVDEDVAYRFARAQAQVDAAAREESAIDWAAAKDAELGARVGHGPGRRA